MSTKKTAAKPVSASIIVDAPKGLDEGAQSKRALTIYYNGKQCAIPVGVETIVPLEIAEMLDNQGKLLRKPVIVK